MSASDWAARARPRSRARLTSSSVMAGSIAALRVPLRTLASISSGWAGTSPSTPASTTLTSTPVARAKALALALPASMVATIRPVTADG